MWHFNTKQLIRILSLSFMMGLSFASSLFTLAEFKFLLSFVFLVWFFAFVLFFFYELDPIIPSDVKQLNSIKKVLKITHGIIRVIEYSPKLLLTHIREIQKKQVFGNPRSDQDLERNPIKRKPGSDQDNGLE